MQSMTEKSLQLAVYTQVTAADLMRRTRERLADEEGQTSTEYIGIILVIVAIIAAVVVAAPGIGRTIATEIGNAIESVSD